MKQHKLIVIMMIIIISISSCKKTAMNVPVATDCSLPFTDSSNRNPKNTKYQALLDQYVKKGLPGLLVLIKTPEEGLWIGAAGYGRIEDRTPLKKCSLVYSASVGKTYCAVAIMQLVEEGKLKLEDKINQYLATDICNNIPNGNTATIRDLLEHRSGIPNFEDNTHFIADYLNNPFSIQPDDIIKYEFGKNALFSPGESYRYSSTGYELLAKIIDRVTSDDHSKYYTSHIFKPAGLKNTYYKSEVDFPKPPGLVNSYFDRLGDGKIENISDANNHMTKVLTGSDGIIASIYDYYLFTDALISGKLVSTQSFHEMTEWKEESSGNTNKYGLGLQQSITPYGYKFGHRGRSVGAGIDVFYFPADDVTIITSTNIGTFLDSGLSLKYTGAFQDELLNAVFR